MCENSSKLYTSHFRETQAEKMEREKKRKREEKERNYEPARISSALPPGKASRAPPHRGWPGPS